nr:putative capsid protein [Cressdnaviricota sp.]UOF78934.1 putative capsid protein [Cressdnaviricota sp.]
MQLRSGRNYGPNRYPFQGARGFFGTVAAGTGAYLANRLSGAAQRWAGTSRQAISYSKTKKKFTTTGGITNQHDVKRMYSKKRMPRRKRKLWKRFVQKVDALEKSKLGSLVKVINERVETGAVLPGTQGIAIVHLYGGAGTNTFRETGTSDLTDLNTEVFAGGVYNVSNTTKYQFWSACLDVTFSNQTLENVQEPYTRSIEVDVYEIVYSNKPCDDVPSLFGVFGVGTGDTLPLGTGSIPAITNRGVTPFEMPSAIRLSNMKILKKTKYFLGDGQCATYQIRAPVNWMMTPRDFDQGDFRTKKTHSLLFIVKPVDGALEEQQLVLSTTRIYKFGIQNTNTSDRSSYN